MTLDVGAGWVELRAGGAVARCNLPQGAFQRLMLVDAGVVHQVGRHGGGGDPCSRVNIAHVRQSRPDAGLDLRHFEANVFTTLK